jgi:tetrahydromethanopterin S-methyltransferase subunit A
MTVYPWRGEFCVGNPESQVAVVTLADRLALPADKVAIWGQMKTENLGIEKVVANVVSNPNLRYLVLCGEEVRGHRSGQSLLSLHGSGYDENGRIIGARGAVPYIENLPREAVERFRVQVEIIDLIGVKDIGRILARMSELPSKEPFGEPYIVEFVEREKGRRMVSLSGKISLHKDLLVDPYLEVGEMPGEAGGC